MIVARGLRESWTFRKKWLASGRKASWEAPNGFWASNLESYFLQVLAFPGGMERIVEQ